MPEEQPEREWEGGREKERERDKERKKKRGVSFFFQVFENFDLEAGKKKTKSKKRTNSPISRISWIRGPDEEEDEEEDAEEVFLSSPSPLQYSRIREWIPSRSFACAAAGSASRGSPLFRNVLIAMLAVAASISLAASQHRFPSSYAWKGCV